MSKPCCGKNALTSLAFRWLLGALLSFGLSSAFAQSPARNFDHLKTGFALNGSHASQRCGMAIFTASQQVISMTQVSAMAISTYLMWPV